MAMVMPQRLSWVVGRLFGNNSYVQALEQRATRLEQSQSLQQAITHIIVRSTDLAFALPQIIRAVCDTTNWDLGEIWYIDREANVLASECRWHNPAFSFPEFEKVSQNIQFEPGKGLPGRVWASGKPIWITNVVCDGTFLRAPYAKQDGLHGAFCVPIRTDGEVIGVMSFFSRRARPIDHELLRVLETVGSQIGLFIERKRLEHIERDHAREITILEERRRLACDLHDSVTQTLFSASVMSEMLPRMLDRDPAKARAGLEELTQLTRGALSEMRELLVEMRSETETTTELPTLLKTLVESMKQRSTLRPALTIESTVTLPAPVQHTFYRVAQEALNNIVKHSGATQVQVSFRECADHVELHIEDDGHGFDPSCIPTGHLGLGIMHERARLVGADYQIKSRLGQGTTVTLSYPISA